MNSNYSAENPSFMVAKLGDFGTWRSTMRNTRLGKRNMPGSRGTRSYGCSEASADSVQRIRLPHLGVPSLEPPGEDGGLSPLLDGGDGQTPTTGGVRVHVLLGWKREGWETAHYSPSRPLAHAPIQSHRP